MRTLAAAVVALCFAGAACGGGASTGASSAGTTTTPGPADQAALQAFRTCMQQHGVTLPSRPPGTRTFGGGGGGLGNVLSNQGNPADQAAVQACKDKLPAGLIEQQQARRNRLNAFYSCLADHGVTTTTGAGTRATIDTSSDAYKTCSPLLPTRPRDTTTA